MNRIWPATDPAHAGHLPMAYDGTVKLANFRFLNPQAVGADSRWEPDALGIDLGVLPST